jgi:MFS family permease
MPVEQRDLDREEPIQPWRGLVSGHPRPVWMLMLAVVVLWIGRGMVIPFTVIFFTQIVGLRGSLVGGGIAGASLVGIGAVTLTASLIDRHGGKPVLAASVMTMGIANFLLAWAESIWPYLAFTLVFYVASQSYWPAIDSLTTSLARQDRVITTFSMVRVANAVGIGAGGFIGGLLVSGGGLSEYRTMYMLGGALFLAGALMIWTLVPAPAVVVEDEDAEPSGGWRRVLEDRTFLYAMLLLFVLVLGFTQMNMSVPPFLRAEAGVGEGFIGALFFLNTVLVIALQVPIAARVDRGSPALLLSVSALTWAAAFAVMVATVDFGSAALLVFTLFTAGELLFMPLSAVFAVRLAPVRLRGRYFSLLSMTWGGSAAIATLAAGWIQEADNPVLMWPVMVAIMLAAAAGSIRLRHSARLQPARDDTDDSPEVIAPAIVIAGD